MYLYYPSDYATFPEGSLPLVVFMHGKGLGGDRVQDFFGKQMEAIGTWGFIGLLPKVCTSEWCFQYANDVVRTVTDTKGSGQSDVLRFANYSSVGLMGQSMGGNAVVKVATWQDALDINVRAVVGIMPAVMYDPFTLPARIRVPVFFETGTIDVICPFPTVRRAFDRDPMADKIYVNIEGAEHEEETNYHTRPNLPYMMRYLRCKLSEDAEACDLVYGSGPKSLCNNGVTKYKDCIVPDLESIKNKQLSI